MNTRPRLNSPRLIGPKRRTLVLRIWVVIGLCITVLLGSIYPRAAKAAPLLLFVDRFDDDPAATACTGAPNDCSLRGAIITTNANLGPDTITLPAGTYLLDEIGTGEGASFNGDLDINGILTINGDPTDPTIIDGNGAVTLENVFTIDGSYAAELNNLTITGGSGNPVGGIIALGALTLNYVIVDDNHGTGSGGGIYISTALIMTDSTVSNNTAGNGAGIYVHAGTVTITSSTLSSNIATGPGGAIYQNAGTIVIESTSQILLNQASGGGGIITNGGTLTVNDSSIYTNQATSSGGGISIGPPGSVNLNNTSVTSNDSTGSGSSGGGIKVYGSLVMNGGQIALNTAGNSGGGISVGTSGTADVYDASINDNHTTEDPSYGGGIDNFEGQLALYDSTVMTNRVSGTPSSSFSRGGGIHSSGGDLTLTDSMILDNDALDSGGGVFFSNGNLNITNTVFRGNELSGSASAGGGLFNGTSSTTIIKQAEFSTNTSADSSGGIHNQGTITLENSTISGNSASFAAGMLSTAVGGSSILNSTIYANKVPSGSGVGGLVAYTNISIKNTIIAGNDNDECLNGSGTSISSSGYNLSSDNTCGFGATGDQINTNPLLGPLADNGGFSMTHAPLPGSAVIDAGTNSGCPAVDQRGVNRPIDGDANGTAVCDIGALEVQLMLFLPLIMR